MGHMTRLLVRASALPITLEVALGLSMYMASGPLAKALALVFVLSTAIGTLLWVVKSIGASVTWFQTRQSKDSDAPQGWLPPHLDEKSAIDQLAFEARSKILYSLLAGYLLLAFVFGLAYHAVEGTSAVTLGESCYFSLTTLSTVGYGDITPQGFGRVLAGLEMVTGVAYSVLAIGGGTAFLLRLQSHGGPE